MIEISYRDISSGEFVLVTDLKARCYYELDDSYRESNTFIYLNPGFNEIRIRRLDENCSSPLLRQGRVYSRKKFSAAVEAIRACGRSLHDFNHPEKTKTIVI